MANKTAAHTHPWKISDVVIFPLLAAGFVIEFVAPTSLQLPRNPAIVVGILIALAGLGLIHWSKKTLDRSAQPSLPNEPTTKLVITQPFGFSRNPNYLGAVIALLGGAIAVDSLWLIASAALTAVFLDYWMIRPEEKYLSSVFGSSYSDYKTKVRRWF